MWDFERFCKTLNEKHLKNADALRALLRILFALSFEVKAGRIKYEDLITGRGLSAMVIARMNEKGQKTPMMLVEERYPQAEVNDETLSNEIVAEYLVRGILDLICPL